MGCAGSAADRFQAAVASNSQGEAYDVLHACKSDDERATVVATVCNRDTGDTAMHEAARRGQFAVVATVLDVLLAMDGAGVSVSPAGEKRTPPHVVLAAMDTANKRGRTPLHECVAHRRDRWAETTHALLAFGCDPNRAQRTPGQPTDGDTPLHTLARVVADDKFDASKSFGGNLSRERRPSGSRRGSNASSFRDGDYETVFDVMSRLVEAGASIDATNAAGKRPYDLIDRTANAHCDRAYRIVSDIRSAEVSLMEESGERHRGAGRSVTPPLAAKPNPLSP